VDVDTPLQTVVDAAHDVAQRFLDIVAVEELAAMLVGQCPVDLMPRSRL
jgi:hypothetical protein